MKNTANKPRRIERQMAINNHYSDVIDTEHEKAEILRQMKAEAICERERRF